MCGLKLSDVAVEMTKAASHPSWVCGLKLREITSKVSHIVSHPSWVCGLKPPYGEDLQLSIGHTLRGCVD